jgi:cytochrome c-type biogenesis protein CcmH
VKRLLVVCAAFFLIAAAPDPADQLSNPAQEARARVLFKQTRCVVCQNESIDDSQADLAHDLRQVIRAQIKAGKSDGEIRDFLVSKYGDFILMKPRFNAATAALWGAPFVIVLVGVGVLLTRRRREDEPVTDLTPDEEARLKALVEQPPEN